MPTINAGASASILLSKGYKLRLEGYGVATLGPGTRANQVTAFQRPITIGPFRNDHMVYVTANGPVPVKYSAPSDAVFNGLVPIGVSGALLDGITMTVEVAPGYNAASGQWFRNGTAIGGATGLAYNRVTADDGQALTFVATGIPYTAAAPGVTIVASSGSTIANALSLTGPATVAAGVASGAYTVALSPGGGTVANPVTVTPTPVSGVTFAPTSLTLTTASPSGTFTATVAAAGTVSIAVTNNGGLSNPAAIPLTATSAANFVGGDRLYGNESYATGASGPRNAVFKDEAEAPVNRVRIWIGTKTTSGTQATYQAYVAATEEGRTDTVQRQFAPFQGGVVNDSVTTSGPGFRKVTWNGADTVTPDYVTGQGTGQSLAHFTVSDWVSLPSIPRTDVSGGRPMYISRVSQITAGAAFPGGASNTDWHLGTTQPFYREHCANIPPSTATNSYPTSVNLNFGDPLYCWLEFEYAVPTRNVLLVGDSRRVAAKSLYQADGWVRRALKGLSTPSNPICITDVAGSGHNQTQFVAMATDILNNGWVGTDILIPGFSQNGFNQADSGASYIAAIDVLVNLALSKGIRVLMDTDYAVNGYATGQTSETGRQNCIAHAKALAAQGKVTVVDTDAVITDYSGANPAIPPAYNTSGGGGVEGAAGSGDGIHVGPTAQITRMAPALAAVF